MKSVIASIVAVAGIAAAANAQSIIDLQVSLDGLNWSDSVDATPGQTVETRLVFSYTGTASPVGLASAVVQPTVSNWGADLNFLGLVNNGQGANNTTPPGVVDDVPGAYGRIRPFGRNTYSAPNALKGFVQQDVGVNYLRIGQTQATSFPGGAGNTTGASGVAIAQLSNVGRTAADPEFKFGSTGIVGFKFGFAVAGDTTDYRSLDVTIPLAGIGNRTAATGGQVYYYGDLGETTGLIRGTATVDGATVNIVPIPAPGALALLGLGGIIGGRRRR